MISQAGPIAALAAMPAASLLAGLLMAWYARGQKADAEEARLLDKNRALQALADHRLTALEEVTRDAFALHHRGLAALERTSRLRSGLEAAGGDVDAGLLVVLRELDARGRAPAPRVPPPAPAPGAQADPGRGEALDSVGPVG